MGSGKTRRDQRKAQKQRKRRSAAQAARSKTTQIRRSGLADAASWPVTEAWISADWHEPGVVVHAALFRGHQAGAEASVHLRVDLAGDAPLYTRCFEPAASNEARAALAEVSEATPLIEAPPEAIARLLEDGLKIERRSERKPPPEAGRARELLKGLDANDCPWDFHILADPDDLPTEEAPTPTPGPLGWLGRLFRR